MDKFLTVGDVCGLLKVTRGTAIRWIRGGELKAFKLGGGRLWRIRRTDLRQFIEGKPSKNK